MDRRQRCFAGPGHLRLDITNESRGFFCHGVRLPPIRRCSSPKRENMLPRSAVDIWRRRDAERKLKLPQMFNRGRPQIEPLRPRLLLSGLKTSKVLLPYLPGFQPPRPADPRPPKAGQRRPLRTEPDMDFGLFMKNGSGFPRYGAR